MIAVLLGDLFQIVFIKLKSRLHRRVIMNNELLMVFLPGLSWILFALGGTQISDKIQGWKGWRRFILPFVYGVFCIITNVLWRKIMLVMALAGIVFSLPYGHKVTWKMKPLIALGYGLISIPIGFSIWNLFTVVGFLGLFKLSTRKPTASIFIWKICEGSFGILVGIQLAYVLMGKGTIY